MQESDHFKGILMVDVTLIAGLLILISLFPERLPDPGCDFVQPIKVALFHGFVAIASMAFFTLSFSALLSFIAAFGPHTIDDGFKIKSKPKKLSRNRLMANKHIRLAPYYLTFAGLLIISMLAYYLLAFNWILPDSAGCIKTALDGLSLSDDLAVVLQSLS